jgi:hypothetical protein
VTRRRRQRSKPFAATGARVLRRNAAALAAVVVLGVAAAALSLQRHSPLMHPLLLLLLWGGLVSHFAKPRPITGEVVVSRAGLRLGGALIVRRQQIAFAEVRAGVVVLRGHDGRDLALVRCSSADEVAAVIDALALGTERRVTHYRLPRRTHVAAVAAAVAALAVVVWLLGGVGGWYLGAGGLGAALVSLFIHRRVARSLDVGTDGVLLVGEGARRMVTFAEIERIAPFYAQQGGAWSGVELVHVSGERITIPVERAGATRVDNRQPHARTEALVAELERYRALAASGGEAALADELRRGDADEATWLARLGRLVSAHGYRERSDVPERLYRILDDPSQEPSARAGAAAVLQALGERDHRERLRIAAESTAAPELRASLEELAVAESEEDRRRALSRLTAG